MTVNELTRLLYDRCQEANLDPNRTRVMLELDRSSFPLREGVIAVEHASCGTVAESRISITVKE